MWKCFDEVKWCVVCIMLTKPSSVFLYPAVWLAISLWYLEFITIHKAKLPSGSVLIWMLHSLKFFFSRNYWTLMHAFHQLFYIPFSVLIWKFCKHEHQNLLQGRVSIQSIIKNFDSYYIAHVLFNELFCMEYMEINYFTCN